MKMRKLAPGLILEYLEELKVFSPRSRELVQASRTMKLESSSGTEPLTPFPVERRRSGSMGASSSENPFVRPPLDRAKKHLETIERAAYEGDRRLLLQSLERLGRLQARTPEVAYLEQLGRTEASLAASFHGWQDVLTVCLDWDLQDAGTRSGGWFTWVRLMAGADLACRQGRGQDLDGLLLRLQMTPGKEALTPVQQAYLERWQASLSEVASLPLDRLP
jgi:hypothetical protein